MGELEIFSNRIKQLRKSLEMTQKDFSDFIGVKQQTLSGYERGIMKPSLDIVKVIAEKCNTSIDWLCGLNKKINYDDSIKTYGDAIRLLLKLEEKLDITVSFDLIQPSDYAPFIGVASIIFGNAKMQDFIMEWEKIKKIHDESTIDDEVYDLWVEKTIKKYDNFLAVGDGWETELSD